MKHFSCFLLLLSLFCSCANHDAKNRQTDSGIIEYASLLTINDTEGYSEMSVADPWHQGKTLQYINVSRQSSESGLNVPNTGDGEQVIPTLSRAVVFTTAHCWLLNELGVAEKIVGVCDAQYILNADIKKCINEGKIADCGNAMNPDIEKIIDLQPDALIVSPIEGSNTISMLKKTGIPIIEAADYMETSALGRAEWMKYYGRLFGCSDRADSLFQVVDSSYQHLKKYAAQKPKGRSILTERKTGTVWYTPGGQSSIAAIIADANGSYMFSTDTHAGSLALSFEQIIDQAGESDIWAFKYNGTKMMTKADLLREFHGYKALKAFRTGEIYECNCSVIPYFDEVSFRPDYLLQEMIQLLHPGVGLGGLRYYSKLEE